LTDRKALPQVTPLEPFVSIEEKDKMPGLVQELEFKSFTIKKLHPTFVAEIEGIDFSQPISDESFREILDALAKVDSLPPSPIPVLGL
jgi:hypothetical protein